MESIPGDMSNRVRAAIRFHMKNHHPGANYDARRNQDKGMIDHRRTTDVAGGGEAKRRRRS